MSSPAIRRLCSGILLLAALLGAGCGETPVPPVAGPSLQAGTLEWQGRHRTFQWGGGATADRQKGAPLVLVLHGSGGSGSEMIETSGFLRLAAMAGFVAVFPDGVSATWADGRGTTPADRAGVDDAGFLRRLVHAVAGETSVDGERVYAAGYSNGGMMVQRLVLEAPGLLAAAASVGAGLPEPLADRRPVGQVPALLLIHGTADPVVPWHGGEVNSANGGRVLSAPATAHYWAEVSGADPTPESASPTDRWDDGTRVRTESYRVAGHPAARVVLVVVEGAGHGWPGDPAAMPDWVFGRRTRELDAAPFIWEFLRDRRAESGK